MRADFVVVSPLILHLFGRIGKRQEAVGVQTLRPEATVECLDIGIVRRLSRPAEVECHALCIGPEVEIAGDEIEALVDADRLRIANLYREGNRTHIRAGRIPDAWKDRPDKLRQKDRHARWTIKFSKAKPREDGTVPPVDIAIPTFGYQNHISIDREHGLIRKWLATDAAAYEGARLREGLLDKTNTSKVVWADTAYRSAANEAFMEKNGFVSRIHRKKPKGRPVPARPCDRVFHAPAPNRLWLSDFTYVSNWTPRRTVVFATGSTAMKVGTG